MEKKQKIRVVGAGLAGSEAAYQLAKRGYEVELYEMRPQKMTPAHTSDKFAELVCSNSFRSNDLKNAVGIIKEEMRRFGSLIMNQANAHQIPAGSALAVDREGFSESVSQVIKGMDNIKIVNEEFTTLDDMPTLIATGPLTSESLAQTLQDSFGQDDLHFYDAVAPIVSVDKINFDIAYRKSRYDKGDGDDYINCPMDKETFMNFYQEVMKAEQAPMREFEDVKVFEACMPIEEMAKRGIKTMLFGPLKPVGLETPDGQRPYAVVQLRQDDAAASLYNLVGFQTRMKWPDQKRIIQMIPGLENVDIVRYGVMHRNTYLKAPLIMNEFFQSKKHPHIFFAGQVSGVEGYVESASTGLYAALNMMEYLEKGKITGLSGHTMMGSLGRYVAQANPDKFQPMNINFGIVMDAMKDREKMAERSLTEIDDYIKTNS